jgi:hypothetical protein
MNSDDFDDNNKNRFSMQTISSDFNDIMDEFNQETKIKCKDSFEDLPLQINSMKNGKKKESYLIVEDNGEKKD